MACLHRASKPHPSLYFATTIIILWFSLYRCVENALTFRQHPKTDRYNCNFYNICSICNINSPSTQLRKRRYNNSINSNNNISPGLAAHRRRHKIAADKDDYDDICDIWPFVVVVFAVFAVFGKFHSESEECEEICEWSSWDESKSGEYLSTAFVSN